MKKIFMFILILELISCAGGTSGTSFAGNGIRTRRSSGNVPRSYPRKVKYPIRYNR